MSRKKKAKNIEPTSLYGYDSVLLMLIRSYLLIESTNLLSFIQDKTTSTARILAYQNS